MPSTNDDLVLALSNTWKRILPISVVANVRNTRYSVLLLATMVVNTNE
ncbi:hypothetical protein ACO22_07726 [Paracoccidioides brasiliensis]|uniref:Uncharacterized protein n=1 Tax=Paracoccidioides brasiliensis TaxID=121759 RepID=A0A1D2J3Y4_PARBR|nr:hypothetical protein ACO22_07726 [Paracoccidioides brasiliensis]